ncbi:MAG: TadE/TadG family type IV pilus assembly protein [Hyphomonadaceae bacterium]
MSWGILKIGRAWRRLARREDGSAAVEFGLVAMPFFLLIVAMGEVSLMAMAQTNLDFAVHDMARRIRTGQVQTENLSATEVNAEVCSRLNEILTLQCDGNLFVDVDTYESFNDVANPTPIRNGELDQGQISFQPGDPGEIVLVRAFYRWQIVTPFFGTIFGNVGDDRLMVSSILVRNEPFPVPEED